MLFVVTHLVGHMAAKRNDQRKCGFLVGEDWKGQSDQEVYVTFHSSPRGQTFWSPPLHVYRSMRGLRSDHPIGSISRCAHLCAGNYASYERSSDLWRARSCHIKVTCAICYSPPPRAYLITSQIFGGSPHAEWPTRESLLGEQTKHFPPEICCEELTVYLISPRTHQRAMRSLG